ncbi:MAG: hypothetical protein M5U23_03125 [Acidimicrobiia bacterium]|nr:hypothetical protein [Acidimicrobiia bacterium]
MTGWAGFSTTMKIAIALLALGAILAAVGLAIGGVFLAGAVIAFGAAAMVAGLDSIRTRQHLTSRSGTDGARMIHHGPSAVIFGVGFVAVGAGLTIAGIASILGKGDELWDQIVERPGFVLVVLGLGFILMGVGTAVSKWTFEDGDTVWLQRIPGILVGIILVVIGVFMIALGWSLAQDPPTSDGVFERIVDTITGWIGFE